MPGVSMIASRMKRPTATSSDAEQKRQPPAPREELLVGHLRADGEDHRRQEQAGGDAHLRPAARRSPRRPRGECSTAISTAPPHSPPTPMPCAQRSSDEQHRRPDADRAVGRQQPNQERRDAHDQQRPDEHRLAAEPVAVVPEDDAAERAGDEADRERAERDSVPTSGSTVGKNSLLKTSAAAVPYRKKSYHSIVVPMKLARMIGRIDRRSPRSAVDVDRSVVVVAMLDAHLDTLSNGRGSRSGHSMAITPPSIVSSSRPRSSTSSVCQPIEIDVIERQRGRPVFLDQRERRAADIGRVDRRAPRPGRARTRSCRRPDRRSAGQTRPA